MRVGGKGLKTHLWRLSRRLKEVVAEIRRTTGINSVQKQLGCGIAGTGL